MASLSHDMILDVLSCLGVKDLLRFKCVSKPFCSSIDDPVFINLHISHSLRTNNNLALILRSSKITYDPDIRFSVPQEYSQHFYVNFDSLETAQKLNHPLAETPFMEIKGCCNGLMVLMGDDPDKISLWNPSTRKSRMLPFSEIEYPPMDSMMIAFGYDPISDAYVYGFGYDSISDDYKFVRIIQFRTLDSEVKVYSLRTNSWRRIKDFPFYFQRERAPGVLVNRALHWLVWLVPKKPESDSFIAAFDLETEEYRAIELPGLLDATFHLNVRAIGGCLCLFVSYWGLGVADIWMMKEYGVKGSWTNLTSMSIQGFHSVFPLAFSKDGNRVLMYIDHKKLIWYDMGSKSVDEVRIEGDLSSFVAEMLVESLVPLNPSGAIINE